MKAPKRMAPTELKKLGVFVFIISFFIFFATSAGNTPHNYFTRLADALIHGRLYLTEAPSWLSEVVPVQPDKFYVVQPPMPAILAIPFVLFFGIEFPQQILAHLVGAAVAVAIMYLAYVITEQRRVAVFGALLGSIGTIMWFESATGSVWYLGQLVAVLFLLLGIIESITSKRPFLVGVFLGAAYLSRIHTVLSLPFYFIALKDQFFSESLISSLNLSTLYKRRLSLLKQLKWKALLQFALGAGIFFLLNAVYNYARWGAIWDKGYFLIPGILDEPWFSKGMLNIAYIPDHLQLLFLRLPNIVQGFPYIQPSWYGLAIWLTTPLFLLTIKAPWKPLLTKMSWVAIGLIFLILGLRGGTGWTQFGYRYAVDFHAFLLYLLFLSIKRTGLKRYHWLLLIFGIMVNFWGVLWINKYGWVSF